jgi:hypothetical protein
VDRRAAGARFGPSQSSQSAEIRSRLTGSLTVSGSMPETRRPIALHVLSKVKTTGPTRHNTIALLPIRPTSRPAL